MATNFRNIFSLLLPRRFVTGDGEKVLWSLALIKDFYVKRVRLGLEARMPTRAGESANALTGDDRGIPRGRSEEAAHYAQRLIGWRFPRGHRVRGSAFALLDQIGEYFGGIKAWTIDAKQNYHLRTADGVTSFSYGSPWDWDGAGAAPNWARFWVVIEPGTDAPEIKPWVAFADPFAVDGASIGQQGFDQQDAAAIRNLFRGDHPWKPAGTRAEWLIINLDGSNHTPDGTWLHWSREIAGIQQPARPANWRFIRLRGTEQYAGDPLHYPPAFAEPGGAGYSGVAVYPALIPMPHGGTIAGNPASFPATIPLIDDGDLP